MLTFKWQSNYGTHTQTYDRTWNQLGYCKACYKVSAPTETMNLLGERLNEWFVGLASYASPIVYVRIVRNVTTNELLICDLYVNEELWNCSRTTIQHISRFLRLVSHEENCDIAYHDLKDAMQSEHMKKFFSQIVWRSDGITHVHRKDDAEMRSQFGLLFKTWL